MIDETLSVVRKTKRNKENELTTPCLGKLICPERFPVRKEFWSQKNLPQKEGVHEPKNQVVRASSVDGFS